MVIGPHTFLGYVMPVSILVWAPIMSLGVCGGTGVITPGGTNEGVLGERTGVLEEAAFGFGDFGDRGVSGS